MKENTPKYNIQYTIYHLGQSILEVILALAILAVIITSIVSLTSTSVNTSTYSKNVSQANRYADEAVEYVRRQKEFDGWTNFSTLILSANAGDPDVWCLKTLEFIDGNKTACLSTDFIGSTIFQRTLTATSVNSNSINIDVTVTWTDDKGTHETKSSTTVSNW